MDFTKWEVFWRCRMIQRVSTAWIRLRHLRRDCVCIYLQYTFPHYFPLPMLQYAHVPCHECRCLTQVHSDNQQAIKQPNPNLLLNQPPRSTDHLEVCAKSMTSLLHVDDMIRSNLSSHKQFLRPSSRDGICRPKKAASSITSCLRTCCIPTY